MNIPDPDTLVFEPLVEISVKFPKSMLAVINARSKGTMLNRSAWIRQVIYRELTRSGGSK